MQSVIQEFTIGFYDTSGVFSIYAKQHDTGRKLKFHLCDLDEDYAELLNDDQITITLREQLPNGKSVPDIPIDLSNVDKEELSVTVPITKDMIQMAGTAICELTFGSLIDETIISTVKFKLIIDEILPVPESGYEREWFDTWTELWVSLKALEEALKDAPAQEAQRVANEEVRVSNEEAREAAEQERDEAEQAREAAGTGIIDTAHMWANGMAEGYDEPSATNNARAYAMVAQAVSGLFNGTAAEWESLPLSEKQNYRTVVLNDDALAIYAYNCPSGAMATGGYVSPQVVVPGANIPVRANEFNSPIKSDDTEYTVEGDYRYKKTYQYSFDSWNTKEDGTGTTYHEGDMYTDGVPVTMYAQWTETWEPIDEQYYLTVEADEHVTTHTESQWVDKDDSVEVEATAASGFVIKSGTGLVEMDEPKTISIESELVALKFSSDDNFTLSVARPGWDGTLEYSTDDGDNWTTWDGSELSSVANQPIYMRGSNNSVITGNDNISYKWSFTGKYCTGNIETLLDYQTVINGQHPTMGDYCYSRMFCRCAALTQTPELLAEILTDNCYNNMFGQCESLITAPELPATTLAVACYRLMFAECRSLTMVPELPATVLAESCYASMFSKCTSLTVAPQLSATVLAEQCYVAMFDYCTSLTIAPELPATTLADYCYQNMFYGCSSLTTLPQLPTITLINGCYYQMFINCTSLKISATQTGEYQYSYRIPSSGTGTDATNALANMFSNTGGTFTGTPTINTTYYTDHEPI